jgi:membrane-associated protease RseP (regulator of RpoE activity)
VYRVAFGPGGEQLPEYYIGVPVRPLDDAMRAHLDVPAGQGLVATEIQPDSPAAKAGLKPHDILLAMSDKPLTDTETLIAQIQASQGKPVDLKLIRGGKTITIQVTPEKRPKPKDAANPHATFAWKLAQPYQQYQFQHNPNFQGQWQMLRDQWANTAPGTALQFGGGEIDKKLDALSAQIKKLQKSVDELKKSLDK